jgi:hypothetical protein
MTDSDKALSVFDWDQLEVIVDFLRRERAVAYHPTADSDGTYRPRIAEDN